jgi:hypothetical protein
MKSRYSLYTFLIFAVLLCLQISAQAQELPDGFVATEVATGMTSVTRMELLPDGRILVCEQSGRIRVIVKRCAAFDTVSHGGRRLFQ